MLQSMGSQKVRCYRVTETNLTARKMSNVETIYNKDLSILVTSLVAQSVKSLPTMWEIQVQPLGWEDPLEKEQATHSSIPAWKIPLTEEPGGLQTMGSQRVRHN